MKLIIDTDQIQDNSKRDWLMNTLKMMKINYQTVMPQTIDEYNREIEQAENEIDRGEFITATDLKKEAQSW